MLLKYIQKSSSTRNSFFNLNRIQRLIYRLGGDRSIQGDLKQDYYRVAAPSLINDLALMTARFAET